MDAIETILDAERRPLPMPDSPALEQALLEANIHTLLMVYVHLTHDEAMLDQFKLYIRPPFANPPAEIPREYLDELREKLRHVLTTPGAARQDDPPVVLIAKMMNVGTGEPVDDEFVPMSIEQNGFAVPPPRKEMPDYVAPPTGFKVLVIGAGLTGLLAGIKLEEAGIDYITIEKNAEVGGTWWENRYPGVGVDTPSHFYSYSFEINPDWNHYHPHGRDMLDYLVRVADKYRLRDKIRFNTRVTALHFDEAAKQWDVTVVPNDGAPEVLRVSAVINAHGPVNRWKWPDIAGLDTFRGVKVHTATWDESLDLAGKKVAVIGTGASAAQFVPAVAPQVEQLTVFMRSKHWVIYNPEIMTTVTDGVKWALRYIPHYREWFRFRAFWFASDGLYPNVVKDPAYEGNDLAVSALNEGMRQYSLAHMQYKLGDRPDLIEKLTPDFPIFSKRLIMDGGWFDALKRPNVALEDGGIECITPTGIRMRDGREIEVDILVCATGFNLAKMTGGLEITGRAGHDLNAEWGEEDPRAYMGLTVPGYPNYFHMSGPNSGPNHAAGLNLISEVQVHYTIECLQMAFAAGKTTVEPTPEAYVAWNEKIDARMQQMIWTHPRANSYYNNSKGRIVVSFPFRLVDCWNWGRAPDPTAYTLS